MSDYNRQSAEPNRTRALPRFFTLWAINDQLDLTRLRHQMDEMKRQGFDGTVFHPRFYPNKPPYLEDQYLAIVSQAILHAKSIGLDFWIYDENGWPSGTVGGELLRRYPDCAQQWAELPESERDGKRSALIHRSGTGVDYLQPALAQHFIELTHERYRQGLDPAAFEYVGAFFCDEPEFGLGHAYDRLSPNGAIPWTPRLPELYRQRYGEELDGVVPLLFFPGNGHREVRIRFWELLTDLFCESFITPIDRWCATHGKRLAAHVKGEEHPLFQVPMVGSAHQVFQHLRLPGIDALGRYPSGNFFPRQVVSAAQQFGNGDCMVECFGGAGWGATPQDLERYLAWLMGHGLNHFVLHLSQYRLTTRAMRDWPPSLPQHATWRDAFPQLLAGARHQGNNGSAMADTLLVAPYRRIMAEYEPRELLQTNIHDASTYPDTPAGQINRRFLDLLDRVHGAGAAYHISDECTLEQHGRLESGRLRVGRCSYSTVVMNDDALVDAETRRLLCQCGTIRDVRESVPVNVTANTSEPPATACVVEWKLQSGTKNDLVLEAGAAGISQYAATFHAAMPVELEIAFADDVQDVQLNGALLDTSRTGRCVTGPNEIRFKCQALDPFVTVRGIFAVRSCALYVAGPNGTLATEGPFIIEPAGLVVPHDLISAGYPFCFDPLILRGTAALPVAAAALRLLDVQADCARVEVDGVDCDWCWAPDWTVRLPSPLPTGPHVVAVHLTPSTFNRYGPHHHVDGDRGIVSPSQYEYVKNFADRLDSPARTRVSAWHFKRLGLGDRLEIISVTGISKS